MTLKKAGVPKAIEFEDKISLDPADINTLMRLGPGDSEAGWRVIATYRTPSGSYDKRYRAAHARAQHIRAGRVGYLSDLGQWDAKAVLGLGVTHLYLRYLGTDGKRWAVKTLESSAS